MNYKKIVIPCFYNNPDLQTKQRSQMGCDDVSDDELIERDVLFYNIDNVGPRLDNDGIVCGSIIHSGNTEYESPLLKHEIDEIIRKTFEQ